MIEKSWHKLLPPDTLDVCEENLHEFFATMFERQQVWYKRNILKQPAPWTNNPLLRNLPFTNVYRELDRSSQWLIKNVLTDHTLTIENLIYRIIVYRFYNLPETFGNSPYALKLPNYRDFDGNKLWQQTVTYRQKVGNPWHVAYLMKTGYQNDRPQDWDDAKKGMYKDYCFCVKVFRDVRKLIPEIVSICKTATKPEQIIKVLEKINGVSHFMSHEFYIDFCYCAFYWKRPIMQFTQNDFTNAGPGAKVGLRLIFPSLQERDAKQGIEWLRDLAEEQLAAIGNFKYVEWHNGKYERCAFNLTLHSQEMWLCEFQKYKKQQWGLGKQKTKFVPHAAS